jgi:hypothetical protein
MEPLLLLWETTNLPPAWIAFSEFQLTFIDAHRRILIVKSSLFPLKININPRASFDFYGACQQESIPVNEYNIRNCFGFQIVQTEDCQKGKNMIFYIKIITFMEFYLNG